MKFTSSHKYIKNISTCGMTVIDYLLNVGRRPQTSERTRKSPHNLVEQKKNEKGIRDGTCPPGRELWKRKGSCTLGSPLVGRPAESEGALWSLGECSSWFCPSWSWERPAQPVPPLCTHRPETRVHQRGWGLGREAQASEIRSRE